MRKFILLLLTVSIVISVIVFIEISFEDSKIFYGFVFAIILGYLVYIILIKHIILKKDYALQIFNEFGYDDEVKDHFENLYKKRMNKNKKIQICSNVILSYLLTNILFYKLEWGKYSFEKDTIFYVKKIAIIIGFYFIFYFFYKILKKYWGTNSQSSINTAYTKVIEEYLKDSFFFNKAKELIDKAPLESFQIEYYYLEIISYYAVKKKDMKKALSIIDDITEKYYKIKSILYLCHLLVRRKEKSEAKILLKNVINLVDNYEFFRGDIYNDITDLLIKLQEYKKAQIYFKKASKSIEDHNWFSTFTRMQYEIRLKKNKISLTKMLKNNSLN
ncbi:MAG: hypothetical protein KAU01_11380 [Candidatus Cloacimonetes bacterium]|nr:hypothetical protein [Candidatus Cloacimonadota bacterium]